ncbi:hypothetical protein [Streptosporangium pseudovulgare]|uniref:DUF998 domain-containing protein n=1 Tax=Streptosporangium pseudovulgare TaxID=35765 RepID=A0ABQ2RGP5_9ACTN|nr:hypothetical protein [Streptosporangium pseudovulgare]GGQ27047.1 hypothetical protein GCM10010140_66490 [Streptosporangium pseudovulgare]
MTERERVRDLLCVAIAIGVVAWGAIGAWTAITVGNYPWNKWIPFANGASKGVVLGMLAAVAVVIVSAKGFRTGWRWAVFISAFIGGGLLGTLRDLQGAPDSVLYFAEPLSDERWYGTTMLLHWAGKVALPAVVCAVVLTLLAARPYRQGQSIASSAALILAGIALLALPVVASSLAPEIQGNGEQVNAGIWAGLRCWIIGIPVLVVGLLRTLFLLISRSELPSAPSPSEVFLPRQPL